MQQDDFWTTVQSRTDTVSAPARTGALRAAVLFASAAVTMALFLAPIAASRTDGEVAWRKPAFDSITTGSINRPATPRSYTVRRSVTQPMPDHPCIVSSGWTVTDGC